MQLISGFTDDIGKNKFHQRTINGCQILVQVNRLGQWHGYVGQIVKASFANEKDAIGWLANYPMAEVD
jgi:hypothetical protein